MIDRLVRFARDEALFEPGSTVLVATSGGGDSVALVHLLAAAIDRRDLDLRLVLGHLDHRMRPGAGRDRAFVEALAGRLGLACVAGVADPPPSSEAQARAVRFEFLAGAARAAGARTIAMAHQADDQAETILLRLLRGTGIGGLAGIRPRREEAGLALVRPLLFATRAELRTWLAAAGEAWVEDPTNLEPSRPRTSVRLELLARLRPELFPAASANVAGLARRAAEVADFLAAEARARAARLVVAPPDPDTTEGRLWPPRLTGERSITLDRAGLVALPGALVHPVLALALEAIEAPAPTGRVREVVERAAAAGVDLDLPGGVRLRVERDLLHLIAGRRAGIPAPASRPLGPEDAAELPGLGLVLETRREREPASLDRGPFAVVLDPGSGRLALRPRREGDRYRPLGAPGSRPLAEIQTDRRVPRPWRDLLPIVTLDDRPVWAPGLPPDESVRVRPDSVDLVAVALRPVR